MNNDSFEWTNYFVIKVIFFKLLFQIKILDISDTYPRIFVKPVEFLSEYSRFQKITKVARIVVRSIGAGVAISEDPRVSEPCSEVRFSLERNVCTWKRKGQRYEQ